MNKGNAPPKLLDLVRQEIRMRYYSIRTEQVYVDWVKLFVFFHGKRHPRDMGTREARAVEGRHHNKLSGNACPSVRLRSEIRVQQSYLSQYCSTPESILV